MSYFIVEMNSQYDPWFGEGLGEIRVNGPIMCYRIALRLAIIHEKNYKLKTWVEAE